MANSPPTSFPHQPPQKFEGAPSRQQGRWADATTFLLALVLGLIVGVVTWMFLALIERVQFWPAYHDRARLFGWTINRFWIVAIPGIGGLLTGLLLQFWESSAGGTGTAELIYALRRKSGRIAGRYTVFKALASVFTVCTGGSAGPEGPMVSIGSGLGSWLGESGKLEPGALKSLTVAGAAAGFAAVFNAPISGVFYAIEILLKEFSSRTFTLVILASVTAAECTRILMGNRNFVRVPTTFVFNDPKEIWFYVILALLAAAVSRIFVAFYLKLGQKFEHWRIPQAAKTTIGGLLVGVLALYLPEAMGNSHLVIPQVLAAEALKPLPWAYLLLLLAGKTVSCPLTVGSGGSGGIYIPFLLMGAALGGLVGHVAHFFLPDAAPAAAFMLLGMGAIFSAMTYAPFTGIILLFELTGNSSIIMPLMLVVGLAVFAAHAIDSESLDAKKLLKKGVVAHEHMELRSLEHYRAKDVMARQVETMPENDYIESLEDFIVRHPYTGYPVVDARGKVSGLIVYDDIRKIFLESRLKEQSRPKVFVKDVMRRRFPWVRTEDSLLDAVDSMRRADTDRVLVMDSKDGSLAGLITESDILGIHHGLLEVL